MCGIAGFLDRSSSTRRAESERIARQMASMLRHRGPDHGGIWADAQAGIALGHRRLAVLDLSPEGNQPMQSADQRYVLAFNGEIYNFDSLREELEGAGHDFRGHSDTEVMLAAFSQWGVRAGLDRFVGMFAFALWDRQQRTLHLARDRAGEKPLYFGWAGGAFVFGSELKALRAHPQWHSEVNPGALALLLRYGYIPAPHCIYSDAFKLLPGSILCLSADDIAVRNIPAPKRYWSPPTAVDRPVSNPLKHADSSAKDGFLHLLRRSVRQQMVADVPVGAFLSGGIDSSTVVALMQEQSSRPVKTFCIGFDEPQFDEAPYARAVAHCLGTDHTEHYIQKAELPQLLVQLPKIYDEPFADTSAIPTVLLCQLARQQVTVSLSGDAGDELFGGYARYSKARAVWPWIHRIPKPLRRPLGDFCRAVSDLGFAPAVPAGAITRIFNRLANLGDLVESPTDASLYERLISSCRQPESWLLEASAPPLLPRLDSASDNCRSFLQRMMHLDFISYLPDDILVKVDRAAMSVSLETRIPLLDHNIIEFALSLPESFRQKQGKSKRLLREILYNYVPRRLVDRPKRGFAVPISEWLRGPLRLWADELLSAKRLREEGFFNEKTVRQNWLEHLSKRRDWATALWNVLSFQGWLDEQKSAALPPEPWAREIQSLSRPEEAQLQMARLLQMPSVQPSPIR